VQTPNRKIPRLSVRGTLPFSDEKREALKWIANGWFLDQRDSGRQEPWCHYESDHICILFGSITRPENILYSAGFAPRAGARLRLRAAQF
jgi:hypothetical protein